ncbi:hypothetical protein ABC255_02135 [Neobacillus sp. 3P2-tot-E-2]|uniref:hypothetical protein n=1 Tax=Neobacillus sp. 3P2-tot-E-2 TaxID=3132212 RepID=UPI0039A2798A
MIRQQLCELIDWEEFKKFQLNEGFIEQLNIVMGSNDYAHSNQAEKIANDLLRLV